jgi:hypothetical protein
VLLANRYGWRVGTHAVGETPRSILVLDAYTGADKDKSIKDSRFHRNSREA